jgi:hypothetical protein
MYIRISDVFKNKNLRKLKLQKLNKERKTTFPQKYDWQLIKESNDDMVEDLLLFCISITKDLYKGAFYTNENGEYKIDEIDKENLELVLSELQQLNQMVTSIKNEKLQNNKLI